MTLPKAIIFLLVVTVMVVVSCDGPEDPDPGPSIDNFDRGAMLQNWADNKIIPGYATYVSDLKDLATAHDNFTDSPSEASYNSLTTEYLKAYKSWQFVGLYNIGKAEEIGLLNYTNVYPTNVELIESHIATQDYNLELPSNFAAQGFPAIDYLLYGIANTDAEIIELLQDENYAQYLSALITNMQSLTQTVLTDWTTGFRETFIENDGASATASVDKMVNDFIFHYERYVRSGKVSIPAGFFSGTALPNLVEAFYSEIYTKELFLTGFTAVKQFFEDGLSLDDYLDNRAAMNGTADIKQAIFDQWNKADALIVDIKPSFKAQIEDDVSKMLDLHDELNLAVQLLKVDMTQALDIQVDYIDGDGD